MRGEPTTEESRISELSGREELCTESASYLDFGTAMGAPEKDGGGLTGAASSGDVMGAGRNPFTLRKYYKRAIIASSMHWREWKD